MSAGISNRHPNVRMWFSSHMHVDEALSTHTLRDKYVSEVDDVSARCAIITMATCRHRPPPSNLLAPGTDRDPLV